MKKTTQYILGFLVLITVFVWANLVKSPTADENRNEVEIYFLNVGQGDSELIQKGDYQILIDGGPNDSVLSEVGAVMPSYDRKIETVVLTHPDADHLTGLRQVLKRYEIGKIYYSNVNNETAGYTDFKNTISEKNISAVVPKIGENFPPFSGATFTFLWPGDQFDGKDAESINNTSEVAKFCYFDHCALFTGDIEIDEQGAMFNYYSSRQTEGAAEKPDDSQSSTSNNNIFSSELLKIPHHGSNNGTDQNLLNIVQPKYAVIEVGTDNKYGHPHTPVIDLLQKNNIQYFRTDLNGTIEFVFSQSRIIKK